MTLFAALGALLLALALGFLLWPLLRTRAGGAAPSRQSANAQIYREQLEEAQAEHARGALGDAELAQARREIERRIVDEHAAEDAARAARDRRPALAAALAVGLLLPLVAGLGYWRLGNPDAIHGVAAGAREGDAPFTREQVVEIVGRLEEHLRKTPQDLQGWVLLGRSAAALGDEERVARAYAGAALLQPDNADLIADHAEALAMARGGQVAGEPQKLVRRALELDPSNLKALALAGTAAFESGERDAALRHWSRLLELVPPDSDFARSVQASIAEAKQITQAAPGAPDGKALEGVVSLTPALAAKVSPGDTVFVVARPASGSRMPLAVARITVRELPYRFTLDDSMAMTPAAKISAHAQVVVAARVSKSGDAKPQKGDIEGVSETVAPGAKGLRVEMSRVVE